GARPAKWRWTKSPVYDAPAALREVFPSDRWLFVGWGDNATEPSGEIAARDATLSAAGNLSVDLETQRNAGVPYNYVLEGDVEDVSRQHFANRAPVVAH